MNSHGRHEHEERQLITAYIWRWFEEELTESEQVLGQTVISARQALGRSGLSREGTEADTVVIRSFEETWARLEQEAADSERWAEPSVYRQLEHKRPRGLPSSAELHRLRLELKHIEELKSDPLNFRENVAQRLITSGRVKVARCPTCNGILMSPKAQQCRWCHADWHEKK